MDKTKITGPVSWAYLAKPGGRLHHLTRASNSMLNRCHGQNKTSATARHNPPEVHTAKIWHLQSRAHTSCKSGPTLRLPPTLPPLSTIPCAPARCDLNMASPHDKCNRRYKNVQLRPNQLKHRVVPKIHGGRRRQRKRAHGAAVTSAWCLPRCEYRNGQPLPGGDIDHRQVKQRPPATHAADYNHRGGRVGSVASNANYACSVVAAGFRRGTRLWRHLPGGLASEHILCI
jgi:hypothetical protein